VQIEVVTHVTEAINDINGKTANIIKEIYQHYCRNSGFTVLKALSERLTGRSNNI